jgi:hypothetical protein
VASAGILPAVAGMLPSAPMNTIRMMLSVSRMCFPQKLSGKMPDRAGNMSALT